jgi:hypothetical protein
MDAQKLMGFENPGDQPVKVPYRHWDSAKRALWRSKLSWEIAQREATVILGRCTHLPGCPGETSETEACQPECPDREFRASALVVLNTARQFMAVATESRKPANGPYYAPSREHHSDVIAELIALQAENDALREALRAKGGSTEPEAMITLDAPKALPPKETP